MRFDRTPRTTVKRVFRPVCYTYRPRVRLQNVPRLKRHSQRLLKTHSINELQFLWRVSTAMLTPDIDIAILSVCLSVRLSACHAPVLCLNGLTYHHSLFSIL